MSEQPLEETCAKRRCLLLQSPALAIKPLQLILATASSKMVLYKMPASEVLNDNESVLMVIYEAGPQAAMVKTSKCERVQ